MTDDVASTGFASPLLWRKPRLAVHRETLVAFVLYGMAWLCLFRATGMWFGYPSTQQENAAVEPATQQAMLYSLIPFIGLYTLLDPARVTRAVFRIPLSIVVLSGLLILSVLMSRDVMASVRGLTAVIVISIPMLLFKERYGSAVTFRLLRNFAAFAVLANLAYTVVFPGFGIMGGSLAGSMRGMFMHKNLFGQFSAIAFVLLLPSLVNLRPLRWSTLFYAGTALLALGSVALSLSSTALVLVVVGTGALMLVTLMRSIPGAALRGYLYVVGLTALAIAATLVGFFVAETVAEIVGKDLTLSGRTELWEALVPAIFDHPFVGHGFAMFRTTEYLQTYTSHIPWGPRSTHNSYIEFALNTGVPAAILWIGILLSALARKAVRLPQDRTMLAIRVREVAIILMVMLGAFTEAGLLFAPLITWVLLLAAFGSPEERRVARRSGTGRGR
jgi:O-antigen ligase